MRDKDSKNKNLALIRKHYQRCRDVILGYCKEKSGFRALIGDHKKWWRIDKEKGTAKLFYPNEENYDFLTSKSRTLYYTTQLFDFEVANIEKPYDFEKHQITEQIGGRENTVYHSFFLDLDKAKDKDIRDPQVIEYLEKGARFFANKFLNAGIESFGLAFSGGGIYCILHPRLGLIDGKLKDKEERKIKIETAQRAFDLFIGDTADEFFRANPEGISYIKFDKLNCSEKRQVKTILSVHKKYPYVVIPLDKEKTKIDFERAKLPIKEGVIEDAKNWLSYHDDIENFGNFLKPWIERAKALTKRKATNTSIAIAKEEIREGKWAPCMRNLLIKKDLKAACGATRALAILASYMRFGGVPENKAYKIFEKKAEEWNAETSNIFERWYSCTHLDKPQCFVPSCEKLRTRGSGYPHPEIGELGICTPDEKCAIITHPLDYHKEKKASSIERIKLKYGNKDFGELFVERREENALVEIKKENRVIFPRSKLQNDFIFKEKQRDRIFSHVKRELKPDDYNQFLGFIIQKIEEIKRKREEGGKEKEEWNDEIKEKALQLLRSPSLLLNIKDFLKKHGKIGRKSKKVIVGENENKLVSFLIGLSTLYYKKLNGIIRGEPSSGKTRLSYVLTLLFSNRIIDLFRVTERAIDYSEDTNFDGKILLIKEMEGGKSAMYSLRIVIDPETEEMKVRTVEKDPKTNRQVAVERIVHGRPVLFSTTTNIAIDLQLKDRAFTLSPDMSKEQTQRIFEADNEERRSFFPDVSDELDVIKCAISLLKPVKVKIPFNVKYPAKTLKARRSRAHLLDLVEIIAFLHQYQRDWFTTDGEEEYIIATPGDFYLAKSIASKIVQEDVLNVSENGGRLYPIFEDYGFKEDKETGEMENVGLTMKKIREHAQEYLGRDYARSTLRGYIEELDNANLIVSDDSRPKRWYQLTQGSTNLEGRMSINDNDISIERFGEKELREWWNRIVDNVIANKKEKFSSINHYLVDPISGEKIFLFHDECHCRQSETEHYKYFK